VTTRLKDLTNCRQRRALTRYREQAKVLAAMDIDFITRPDGSLVVAWARVSGLLGVRAGAKVADQAPDWNALEAATTHASTR